MTDPLTPPTPQPIFRTQALSNARQRLHGEILLARPLAFYALTALFTAIAIGIVAFFVPFGYTRKTQVNGVVAATTGISRVVAGQAGTIVERRVSEGQAVEAGEVLFVLSSERSSTAENAVSALLEPQRKTQERASVSRTLQADPEVQWISSYPTRFSESRVR
jgi:membrane fusion protein